MSTTPSPLWFLDRSAGEVTMLLLTAVLVLGIARTALPRLNPLVTEGLHRNVAFLAVAFGGLHVVASVADPFARLTALDAVVPFLSDYRRTWLGLGVVSAYLIAVAVVTSWPARRLGRSSWLWLHRLMYGGWGIAVLHALGTGSDARSQLFLFLNVLAVASVLAAFLGLRVAERWSTMPRLWSVLTAVAVVATLALGFWAWNGPLQPGWARSSGTPPDLLGSR